MTSNTLHSAYTHFLEMEDQSYSTTSTIMRFWKFVGADEKGILTDAVTHRIELLASSNYRAIYKMIEARQHV